MALGKDWGRGFMALEEWTVKEWNGCAAAMIRIPEDWAAIIREIDEDLSCGIENADAFAAIVEAAFGELSGDGEAGSVAQSEGGDVADDEKAFARLQQR
ncbi:MAG TPA: hypothetical protein VMN36_02955 [Verrucomicrobiales bacterium]|nr:hypothetical protein [Verrucomicrobiales bacterium]